MESAQAAKLGTGKQGGMKWRSECEWPHKSCGQKRAPTGRGCCAAAKRLLLVLLLLLLLVRPAAADEFGANLNSSRLLLS